MLKAVVGGTGGGGATGVTAAAVLAANQIVVGDDGVRGIKTANTTSILTLNTGTLPTPITGTALQLVGADGTIGRLQVNSFAAIAAVSVTRANGTSASPTAIVSGDQIGGFNSYGYRTSGGAAYSGPSSSVQSFATENWTSTANGTKIVLATTPNTTTTLTTAVTIDQDQSVAMAGRATVATSLAIGGATIGTNALAVTGTVNISGNTTLGSAAALLWSTDLSLFRDGANILGLRNGTANQQFNIYETATDIASNYSRMELGYGLGGNTGFVIRSTGAGATGTARILYFEAVAGSAVILRVAGTGNIATFNASGMSSGFNTTYSAAAAGPLLKQGANGRVGTFVANGVTPVTVSNSSVAITDAIIISLNTVGGTVGANPPDIQTITAGVGFTVAGLTLDTSTYNYAIIKNAA